MIKYPFLIVAALATFSGCLSGSIEQGAGDEDNPQSECLSDEVFFNRTVNTMMAENCEACHSPTGVASATGFILNASGGYADYLQRNRSTAQTLAKQKNQDFDNESQLILKALSVVDHGGGKVFEDGSERAKILRSFIARVEEPTECRTAARAPFLDEVEFLSPYAQLRRATILLGGRLPTKAEIASVDEDEAALDGIYDDLMNDPAFLTYMERGWNDIFHTRNNGDAGDLDQDTFPNRNWANDLPEDTDEQRETRQRAREGVTAGLRQAPVKLVTFLIEKEEPFTKILTAPYVMVNPFSARSYGVSGQLNFNDTNDANEFLPVTLPGGGASGVPDDEEYYHAGLLSSTMFWTRWESTSTNLNRARTRVFFKIFLDTNILELAPRAADADKVVEYINPVVDFNQCSVCHSPMDPVAGLLKNFDNGGRRRPFGDDWDKSYSAGFNGELLPASRAKDSERWLGEQAAADRRFPIAMVANAYFILTGTERMVAPADSTQANFDQMQRAFEEEQSEIDRIAKLFVESDYNFKVIVKALLKSPLFTASNIDIVPPPERITELEIVGMASVITPEDLARKIQAVFENDWTISNGTNAVSQKTGFNENRGSFYNLFDGIDSNQVTKRLKTPNGVTGAVMNVLANDVACRNVALDFSRPQADRVLFPYVQTVDTMFTKETEIRKNVVHLFERILGRRYKTQDAEVDDVVELWNNIQQDGIAGMAIDGEGRYPDRVQNSCRGGEDLSLDELYTIRSWNAVVAYMLSDFSFFYE